MWGELETQGEGVRRKNSEEWNCIHNHTDSISWSAHPRKPACHQPPLSPGWYLDATLFPQWTTTASWTGCPTLSSQSVLSAAMGGILLMLRSQVHPATSPSRAWVEGWMQGAPGAPGGGRGSDTRKETGQGGRGIADPATLPGLILVRIMEQLHHSSG